MFASMKMGSQGERDAAAPSGWWSVWTRQTTGSTWPTFLLEADLLAGPTLPPPKAGVTVSASNASSWPRSGWRVATGLTQSRQVFCSNTSPSRGPECEARKCVGKELQRGEKTGLCFSLTTPPTYPALPLFLVQEELLQRTSSQRGGRIFFPPPVSTSFHHFMSCTVHDNMVKSPKGH